MRTLASVLTLTLLFGCTAAAPKPDLAALEREVIAAERAFAQTMVDRDFAAFQRFLAEDALFFGGETAFQGRQQVAERWKSFYEAPVAPFSWEPEAVYLLDEGRLAHSSGPVRDAQGKQIATFNSVWRREADGSWKVLIDRGTATCDCE